MDRLRIRKATPGDTNRIADLFGGDPGDEAIGIAGDAGLAREFGMAMVRLPNGPQGWQRTVVAELDAQVVAMIQAGPDVPGVSATPRLVYLGLRIFGPIGLVRLLPRLRARQRVQPVPPPESYYIAEIDVDAAYRNKGIGGALLDYAEEEARAAGHRLMSLTTSTTNPARRLYERHGFRVVETRTNAAYRRYTGIDGRHLMVKQLG
jgi:ribosomal protein S18 acetylase RimI-like enzyme